MECNNFGTASEKRFTQTRTRNVKSFGGRAQRSAQPALGATAQDARDELKTNFFFANIALKINVFNKRLISPAF
jgi:hypothetical protein